MFTVVGVFAADDPLLFQGRTVALLARLRIQQESDRYALTNPMEFSVMHDFSQLARQDLKGFLNSKEIAKLAGITDEDAIEVRVCCINRALCMSLHHAGAGSPEGGKHFSLR
jgi:hypothetical protein